MIKRLEDFLRSKYITVPNEWIPACIEFIKEEHGNNNIANFIWLKDKIYEQWLHADLTDLGTCCLPFNLSREKCITLKGQFVLQINHIKDIGLPSYTQLQKLRKDDVENTNVSADKAHMAAWEPKPSRMLLLQLTDGTSVVQGMEYRSISSFSLSLKPGTKILLKGIIETRKGILLLTHELVTVLGGEVESLLLPNAPENILRRSLRLEDSENPIPIPETFSTSSMSHELSQTQSQYYNTQSTQNFSLPNSKPKAFVNPTHTLPVRNVTQFDDDFEDFMDVETEMALIEAEQRASSGLLLRSQLKPLAQTQRSSNIYVNKVTPISSVISRNPPGVSFNQNVNNVTNNYQTQMSREGNFKIPMSRESNFKALMSQESNFKIPMSQESNIEDSFFEDDDDDLLLAAAEVTASSSKSLSCYSLSGVKNSPIDNPIQNVSRPFISSGRTSFATNFLKRNKLNNSLTQGRNTEEKDLFSSASQILKGRTIVPSPPVSAEKCSTSTKSNLRQTKLSSFVFEKKERSANVENADRNIVEKQDIKNLFGSTQPYQYIYYVDLHPLKTVTYTVKGFVTTLLSRLEQDSGKWSLAAKINDGTGSCDVDIDDQVLRKLMGMSVAEFQVQKQRAMDDPQLRVTLGQRVCKCQMELIRMCCLLTLEVGPLTSRPRVVALVPLTEEHLQQLKARASQLPIRN